MSKLWTKSEEAVLFEAMGDKKVMYAPKAKEIAKKLPGRSAEAIRRHWLLIRWEKPVQPSLLDNLARRGIIGGLPGGVGMPPIPPQYNPVDVAFTRPITKTDIIRHYRDQGLRGKVTIELGD